MRSSPDRDAAGPPGRTDWLQDLWLRVHVAGRWRSGDLLSVEVGGSLGWRSAFVRAGYQPQAEWDFEGRPVGVTAVPLALGWRPVLQRRGWFRLVAEAALLVEHLSLRRLDLPTASHHTHWDAGVGLGLEAQAVTVGRLVLGLAASGFWFPAAQEIKITDGPSKTMTLLGLWFGVAGTWGGVRTVEKRRGDVDRKIKRGHRGSAGASCDISLCDGTAEAGGQQAVPSAEDRNRKQHH